MFGVQSIRRGGLQRLHLSGQIQGRPSSINLPDRTLVMTKAIKVHQLAHTTAVSSKGQLEIVRVGICGIQVGWQTLMRARGSGRVDCKRCQVVAERRLSARESSQVHDLELSLIDEGP